MTARFYNWKDYIQNDYSNTSSLTYDSLPEGCYQWKDMVTGTNFYITQQDNKKYYDVIKSRISSMDCNFGILQRGEEDYYHTFPYTRIKSSQNKPCTLVDAARLYVLFSFLCHGNEIINKKEFRKSAYEAFFTNDCQIYPKAWKALENMVEGKSGNGFGDEIEVIILKGNVSRIKNYYLEDNELKNMRGASRLISYLTEEHIPLRIKKNYIDECVIYSGGGSVACILPYKNSNGYGGNGEEMALASEFEIEFNKYAPGANAVFCEKSVLLDDILFNYKETMMAVETDLSNRARMNLFFDMSPVSSFEVQGSFVLYDYYEKGENETITLKLEKLPSGSIERCSYCRVRNARYKQIGKNKKTVKICAACLHKGSVGSSSKKAYYNEYIRFSGDKSNTDINAFKNIKDDNGDIAVVYADANNMGAVVEDIDRLDGIMYFSRLVKKAARKAVFTGLKETYCDKNSGKFEIIALGGDDIFLVTPGEGFLEFAIKITEVFNEQFRNLTAGNKEPIYNTSLSTGICVGNYKTPIRLMHEFAEKELGNAKKLSRRNIINSPQNESGSISFRIVECILAKKKEAGDSSQKMEVFQEPEINFTLLPYSLDTAKAMRKLVSDMRVMGSRITSTNLYNLKNIFETADSFLESSLFYLYDQARNKNRLEELLSQSRIEGYKWKKGYFRAEDKDGKKVFYSPWSDIVRLWKYSGGDANEKGL